MLEENLDYRVSTSCPGIWQCMLSVADIKHSKKSTNSGDLALHILNKPNKRNDQILGQGFSPIRELFIVFAKNFDVKKRE